MTSSSHQHDVIVISQLIPNLVINEIYGKRKENIIPVNKVDLNEISSAWKWHLEKGLY